jgi:hypothetical protein
MKPPPIPVTCANRPTIGGYVRPWINVELGDGGIDFRSQHNARVRIALEGRRCQVCATPLGGLVVLLGGPRDLRHLLFHEPPLHPECAVYTSHACPVVAGRAAHIPTGLRVSEGRRGEKCPLEGCDCGGWVPIPGSGGQGTGLHPWYAVYALGFQVAYQSDGAVSGALVHPSQVRAVRRVSEPGSGLCWERLENPLADYEPPNIRPAGTL